MLSGDRAGESNSPVAPRRIPIEAQSFRLKLKKYAPREFAVYRVELLDAQGTVRQTVTGKPGADNQIEVVFSCAGLPAGEYLVRVSGQIIANGLELLNHGLELDGKPLKPARVKQLNEDQLHFILKEGKKRQIRRMCELVGLRVTGLKRVRVGRLKLGDLPPGKWRLLRDGEGF